MISQLRKVFILYPTRCQYPLINYPSSGCKFGTDEHQHQVEVYKIKLDKNASYNEFKKILFKFISTIKCPLFLLVWRQTSQKYRKFNVQSIIHGHVPTDFKFTIFVDIYGSYPEKDYPHYGTG